jgi:hypothetical protein
VSMRWRGPPRSRCSQSEMPCQVPGSESPFVLQSGHVTRLHWRSTRLCRRRRR